MSVSAVSQPSPPAPEVVDGVRAALERELEVRGEQVEELKATVDELKGQQDNDSLLEREIAQRSLERTVEAIDDIRHALDRIAAGTYGTCEHCGGPIAAERLEAIPSTRHCVKCAPSFRAQSG